MGNKFNRHQVNNHQTPLRGEIKPRGPVKHGGLRGLVDFNDNPHPLPPAARKRTPNGGSHG